MNRDRFPTISEGLDQGAAVHDFEHPEAQSPMRPDVSTQAAFKKKKPPVTYRYDSSLSPALDWDGQNPARAQGEAEIARIEELSRRPAQIDPEQDPDEFRRIPA